MNLGSDGKKAGELHDDTTVATTLYLNEGAFNSIERSTDDAHGSATAEVKLFGTEVEEVVVVAVADTNEMLHLHLRNQDGTVVAIDRMGEVLHDGEQRLETTHVVGADIHEQEVVDGRDQHAVLGAVAPSDNLIAHGNESLDTLTGKPVTSLQLATVGSAHGVPYLGGNMRITERQCAGGFSCMLGLLYYLYVFTKGTFSKLLKSNVKHSF